MIIILSLIAMFSVFFLIQNRKNKYSYSISIKFMVLSITLVCGLIYLSKGSQYYTPFSIDYNIFLFLNQLKINVHLISRIYNICFATVMLSSVYLLYTINPFRKKYLYFIALIPTMFFVYATDYTTAYNVYIDSKLSSSNIWNLFLSKYGNTTCNFIFVFYIVTPYVFFVAEIIKSKIFTRRKHLLLIALSCFAIDIYTFFILRLSFFKNISFDYTNFSKLPVYISTISRNAYTQIAYFYLIIFATVLLSLFYYKPFLLFLNKSNKEAVLLAKVFNKNLSMQFHVYKNAFLSAGQQFYLINKQIELGNYKIADDLSKKAIDDVQNYVRILENNLKILSGVSGEFYKVNLIECINSAISDTIFNNTNISIEYMTENAVVKGNQYYLTEAFRNLFLNSLDAIDEAGRSGEIKIRLICEADFYLLEITDNGTGIEKDKKNQIFELFYSTKSNNKGNGVGLSYVKNVISAHHGEIRVISSIGKYTTFQITFPVA